MAGPNFKLAGGGQGSRALTGSIINRLKAVIIGLLNRVEFMVVTACASHSQAEECGTGCHHGVVNCICTNLGGLNRILIANIVERTNRQKCNTEHVVRSVRCHGIACNMLSNELIERFVLIQRSNHIIAKRPRVIDQNISLKTIRLTKPGDIKPVAAPAFAICWGSQ